MNSSSKKLGATNRIYSMRKFIKRVICTLSILIFLTITVIFFIMYLPFKQELEKSLMTNFNQVSYIRYAAIQNIMDRSMEGAKSLSSRTMIRDAIMKYAHGEMSIEELIAYTQPKYTDGAQALEYLVKAERFVDDIVIADYITADYVEHSCVENASLIKGPEIASSFCLTTGHSYYAIISPVFEGGQIIAYDRLVFDLSEQIQLLSTDLIQSELIPEDGLQVLRSGADIIRDDSASSVFCKDGICYQAFALQSDDFLVIQQSKASLLEPIQRLSNHVLLIGIALVCFFSAAVYYFVIRPAKNEIVSLEADRQSLKTSMKEMDIDPLTKASLRKYGQLILETSFENYKAGEPSPAILFLDVDKLKKINDVYGHATGDQTISSIAEVIHANKRIGDAFIRWGGDEFVGIFDGLDQEHAITFAQKLLTAVSAIAIHTDSGTIHPAISVGISFFSDNDKDYMDALKRADHAVYKSKNDGGNGAHLIIH